MPNINAALGCAQLEKLESYLAAKRNLATRYRRVLAELDGIVVLNEPEYAQSNYWLNAIFLGKELAMMRDEILYQLHDAGIMARPLWQLMHTLPMYQNCPKMPLKTSEELAQCVITIPSSPTLLDV